MEYKSLILKTQKIAENVRNFIVEKPKDYKFKEGNSTIISINKEGLEKKKRTFSIASTNSDNYLEFIIKIYPDRTSMTNEFDKLKEGESLLIGNPYGKLEYRGGGIFIAGGSGIVPFLSVFRTIDREKLKDKNFLIYSCRRYDELINFNELKSLLGKENLAIILSEEKKKGYYNERVNPKFLAEMIKKANISNPYFYICGPRAMIIDIKEILLNELKVKKEKIIFEGM